MGSKDWVVHRLTRVVATDPSYASGSGAVHNTYLFDKPEKSVIRGPFRVFPKPPWFVTNTQQANLARRLVAFELDPGPRHLPGIFAAALRG